MDDPIDTPVTDMATNRAGFYSDETLVVPVINAREMERENAKLKSEIERLKSEIQRAKDSQIEKDDAFAEKIARHIVNKQAEQRRDEERRAAIADSFAAF